MKQSRFTADQIHSRMKNIHEEIRLIGAAMDEVTSKNEIAYKILEEKHNEKLNELRVYSQTEFEVARPANIYVRPMEGATVLLTGGNDNE